MCEQVRLLLVLGLLGGSVASGAPDEGGDGGGNIGRTEEEDEADETEWSRQLGRMGAVTIPLKIEEDCQATIGLYTPRGQLVRILGQMLDIKKGEYDMRWDGLDLFGNVVPPSQELVCRVIWNKPIRAIYEFSVAAPKVCPWPYHKGEGKDARTGGWLGDHSTPNSAAAIGDKVFIGAYLTEFGSNLIAVNLQGEKLFGLSLAGWTGPAMLASDGSHIHALHRQRQQFYRVEPEPQPRGKPQVVKTYNSPEKVQAFAVHGGRMWVISENTDAVQSPFRVALTNAQIDFVNSQPQVLNVEAATEFLISPQEAFGNTFTTPANPQNGARFVMRDGEGYIIVVFRRPVEVGTFVLSGVEGAATIEAYALDPAAKYDEKAHSPVRKVGAEETPVEHDDRWVRYGQADGAAPMSFLAAPKASLKTTAVYIKVTPTKERARAREPWRPGIAMARLMSERFEAVRVNSRRTVQTEVVKDEPAPGSFGWRLRTASPVNRVYGAQIVQDLGEAQTLDGVGMLNCTSQRVAVDVLSEKYAGEPAIAPDDAWRVAGEVIGKYNRRLGYLSSSVKGNEQFAHFTDRVTTRAMRYRVLEAYRGGKWGEVREDDPFLVRADDVVLLRVLDYKPRPPSHVLRIVGMSDSKVQSEWRSNDYDLPVLSAAPGGQLFSVVKQRLCRVGFEAASGRLHVEPIGDEVFKDPIGLTASNDRIAVGDFERHAVVVFDHAGKRQMVIGQRGIRQRGPWDPYVLERPRGLALASDGSLWVAEERFAPKRVARYASDGKFIEEFLGPPMYGGGGRLDPNLKSFYYKAMEFGLDWEKGTNWLKNLNDTLRSPETPVQNESSFAYTSIGRPLYFQGRRYIVEGDTICMLEGDAWRTCFVMGSANNNPFLLNKECWRKHWGKFDLRKRYFIYCDRNDDGQFQIDEVELFDFPAEVSRPLSGLVVGPDLSLWGAAMRLRPHAVTARGTPLFRSSDIQLWDYDNLAPHYPRNYTLAGSKSAKPHYSGFKYICQDGTLIQEGQPYSVAADGKSIVGGPVSAKPSDFVPPIYGSVMTTPFAFAGGGMTKSQIGEIAVVHSMNGPWYVWAAKYGVAVGHFFNGRTGGFSYFDPVRGTDVTGRKHYWETFHSDFVKAQNGNYYAQGGKGWHAIARIEGLDDYRASEQPVKFTQKHAALNTALRPALKARYEAARHASSKDGAKSLAAPLLSQRTKQFKFDGNIRDWGDRRDFKSMGPPGDRLLFDLAHDEKGVWFVFYGETRLGGAAKDWKLAFQAGFAIDLLWRTSPSRSPDLVAGDRRLVISKIDGKWTAVLYDYVADAPADQGMILDSPVGLTRIARITKLSEGECRIAFNAGTIEDVFESLGNIETMGDVPPAPGEKPRPKPTVEGQEKWSAEAFVPWSVIGQSPGDKGLRLRFDAGITRPARSGKLERRDYWSNNCTVLHPDAAVEATPNPPAFGTVTFAPAR